MLHASAFDRYRAGTSVIHRLDPRAKVVATLAFILSNALLPDGAWRGFAIALACVLAVTALARLPLDYALRRSLVALPFAAAALTIAFTLPGEPVLRLAIGPWTGVASDAGLSRFASIAARGLLSVQMAVLLTATTPFPDILHALAHLRLPPMLVAVLSFTYRYLFVLVDEALRLLRARDARSAGTIAASGGSVRWRARVVGNMVGQLFVRSYERGDRVHQAMMARGYRGDTLTLRRHVMRRSDWVAGVVTAATLAALQWVAR